jgi:uncharacterized protein
MTYTAFRGPHRIAQGPMAQVAVCIKEIPQGSVLVFDDASGLQVDLDVRGTMEEISARYSDEPAAEPRGRGRPRLGVVAKEITLLPRHWDWLSIQPGGASVALRKLVEEARRTSGDADRIRASQEAAYRFMSAVAGNLPDFEEATRALFACDRRRFSDLVANWPEDVRDYAVKLAFADQGPSPAK